LEQVSEGKSAAFAKTPSTGEVMLMPDPDSLPVSAPPEGVEDIYVVHTSAATGLCYVRALNEAEALGKWLAGEGSCGRLICGRIRKTPFPHLEARIARGGCEAAVHVASEQVLADPERKSELFGGDVPC
jgi:hypothetical protein